MPRPSLQYMLERLIALPSVSSVSPQWDMGNRALMDELAQWCMDAGFRVEVLPLPGEPARANLVATLGHGPGGLVLAGHTDTVPCDPDRWSQDPFRAEVRDGRLYGLGSCDMKSFLALALEATADLDPGRLRQPLVILATADEESSMAGARALADSGRPLGRHAVIGEPTGLRPVRMHKGMLMEGVQVTGQAGHSSDPRLGNSALEGMHRVMKALLDWREALQASHRNEAFAVPVPTLNLGAIRGGDNPNRICGECELHLDLRPLPGMDPAQLRATLEARVAAALEASGLEHRVFRLIPGVPPLETPADAPVVRAAEALTGSPAGAVAFGTEAPFLQRLGMDVVILGPGDIAQAHQPDEFLAMDRIPPTLEILRGLIRRFCLAQESGAD
ncbi:acetylornithine deacetylase [Ectothiorhodospira mobilis]|uniref:Acetylornithine deacetylase n=1 Tax=Ectothiorhodospira mobilis TaxID=195064 RepID=A0A1I4S5X1_ECTMO|nr:acetylornithine deacetylase [Ectothiorhodospira mobilis]SFM59771.1 acetylornithine deacetylase [Ectothiorhodospira mobilis]